MDNRSDLAFIIKTMVILLMLLVFHACGVLILQDILKYMASPEYSTIALSVKIALWTARIVIFLGVVQAFFMFLLIRCFYRHLRKTIDNLGTYEHLRLRYGRMKNNTLVLYHHGDCNIYRADRPICSCGLKHDMAPIMTDPEVVQKLAANGLELYGEYWRDFDKQMEFEGRVQKQVV